MFGRCYVDHIHLHLVIHMARILLVEDDAAVEQTVSEFLRSIGNCVISASSAEQARLILVSDRVDLALIDCLMSGEQGNSLAEHVSQLGIPTILTSGDPHYLETLDGQEVPFLPKPFRLTALEELVSRILQPKVGNQSLATKGSLWDRSSASRGPNRDIAGEFSKLSPIKQDKRSVLNLRKSALTQRVERSCDVNSRKTGGIGEIAAL